MEIKTPGDLKQIATKIPDSVTFMLPLLDDEKNAAWSTKFNDLLKECGCSSGQQYLLYATPIYIIGIVLLSSYTAVSKKLIIALFIASLIITGITGKLVGKAQRNRKLNKLVERFHEENGLKMD